MNRNYKKVTSHGSINIPVAMRREMGLQGGDPMEVSSDGLNIIVKPYTPRCIICEQTEDVLTYMGKRICKKCIMEAAKKLVVSSDL